MDELIVELNVRRQVKLLGLFTDKRLTLSREALVPC